jgi:LETM1 and EF-hand domain-containing protein 1
MASRAIARRRKYLFDHVQHGRTGLEAEPRIAQLFLELSSGDSNSEKGQYSVNLTKRNLAGLANGFLRRPAHGIAFSHYGIGRNDFGLPFGARSMLQSLRASSTAAAGQPKLDIGDEQSEDQKQNSKKKEASPEECDQAVEGLSNAKAKAKAKHVPESLKTSQSVIQKFWARLLGIGPALRAVASMSRSRFFSFVPKCIDKNGLFLLNLRNFTCLFVKG